MGVLGLYTIYEGMIGKFSLWSMISGVFWIFVGFHLTYRFYLMTEIVRQHDEKAMLARATLLQDDMTCERPAQSDTQSHQDRIEDGPL
jgi:uncharacterized membrane protein